MKRTIIAAAVAVFSASALAESGLPYEQTEFDRGVYNVEQDASAGNSRAQDSVWANDHNFIAPAQ
jgi:hypothetical protein